MQGRVNCYLLKFPGHWTHWQNGAAALQSQLLSFYPAGSWGSSSEEEVLQRRRVENLIPFSLPSCLYQVASRPTNSQLEFWRGSLLGRAFSGDLSLFLKTGKCFLAVQNSSIGDLVTHWVTDWLTVLLLLRYKERPERPVTFETFDQSDEETWPDQQKNNYKDKDN